MEFIRKLSPSRDLNNFYHLTPILDDKFKPKVCDDESSLYQPIDIPTFFNTSDKEIEIEIGCGKGNFMVKYCTQKPTTPFLAIDNESAIAFIAAKKLIREKKLMHIRILHGDAFYFLRDYLPDNCVKAFHMYFPDPWPKRKHHKKRLLNPEYLNLVKRVSTPDAYFYWATDHKDYHEWAEEYFSNTPWLEKVQNENHPTDNIKTNFEKKYTKEKRPFYRIILKIKP